MSIYAVGDIHGTPALLDALLDRLADRGPVEQLWFVGDLVNRGPDSAGVIRRIRALGERAITLLGNHDLALLAIAYGQSHPARVPAALQSLLEAPDRDILLDWLRRRPLMHYDPALGWAMVHAGLPTDWTLTEARTHAGELEAALRGPDHPAVLGALYGNTPDRWHPALAGMDRLRFITNALTRMRFVTSDARLDLTYKKTLAGAPADLRPWFTAPGRATSDVPVVFGHWSALERVAWPEHKAWCIDTGAAWGGPLTALDLTAPTPELIQVSAEPSGRPGPSPALRA